MNGVLAKLGMRRRSRRGAVAKPPRKSAPAPRSGRIRSVLRVLGALSLVLAAVVGVRELRHWLLSPTTLPIRAVSVGGELAHVPAAQVRTVVGAHLHGGFFGVDLPAIAAALDALPWVAQADVRRVWPDALAIRIEEQRPVATWNGDALLNAAGTVFRPARDTFPKGLPALSGPPGKELDLMSRYEAVNSLFGQVGLHVAALGENARRAFGLRLDNGIEVVIGRDWDMQRMARMVAVYRRVLVGKAATIERIDLRYTNGFAVAWKPSAAQAAAAPGRH